MRARFAAAPAFQSGQSKSIARPDVRVFGHENGAGYLPYNFAHEIVSGAIDRLSDHDSTLPLALGRRINEVLRDRTDLSLSAAESCTGGSVAQAITAFAGSSNYFLGSIVSYVNEAKAELLACSCQDT